MGFQETEQGAYTPGNFFHAIPVEDLPEFNEINSKNWEERSFGPKTKAERFLVSEAGFFPDKLVTTRSIIPIDDVDLIHDLLHEGIENHYSMGIRTVADKAILFGNRLPWEMEVDSPGKIDLFLSETLPSWLAYSAGNDLTISQIILMNNLPEIGTKLPQRNQFVARMKMDAFDESSRLGSPQFMLEMTNGTNKLRDLDKRMEDKNTNRKNIIRYEASYTPTRFFTGAHIQIGTNYFIDKPSEPQIFTLQKEFTFSDEQRALLRPDKITYIDTMFSFLNDAVSDPNIEFLKRLSFLSSIGLPAVEIQGYSDIRKKTHYARIYGLRGPNDETNTGLQTFSPLR